MNDWVQQQATKLPDQGYVALANGRDRGKVAKTPDEAHEILRGVPEDRAKRDLHAAFEFRASRPEVKKDRIGVRGWRLGRRLCPRFRPRGSYTCRRPHQLRALGYRPRSAENDPCSHPRNLRCAGPRHNSQRRSQVRRGARSDGKKIEIKIYDDAGPGFEDANDECYRAADACTRTLDLLRMTLKK